MTFSAAATLLMAAALVIFWPARNAAPGAAAAMAQRPAVAGADPFAPGPAQPNDKQSDHTSSAQGKTNDGPWPVASARIEAELVKPTSIDFVELPLKDAVLYIADVHKIPIYIRKRTLDEAGIPLDKPVTLSLRGVPLKSALDLMLDELELTYFVKDVLIITTPEDAESNLETRVYDCRDLLAMPEPEVPQPPRPRASGAAIFPPPIAAESTDPSASRAEDSKARSTPAMGGGSGRSQRLALLTELEKRTEGLVELVTATVKPDSWDDVGGPGAIDAYNGLFVVSQTAKVHEQVEHMFDMLRKAAGIEAVKGAKVVR